MVMIIHNITCYSVGLNIHISGYVQGSSGCPEEIEFSSGRNPTPSETSCMTSESHMKLSDIKLFKITVTPVEL